MVEEGYLDDDYIKQSIDLYLNYMSKDGQISPLYHLKKWHVLEDKDIEKYIDSLLNSLENNLSYEGSYDDIIKIFYKLYDIGFNHNKYKTIDKVVDLVKANIINTRCTVFKSYIFSFEKNEKYFEKLLSNIEEIEVLVQENKKEIIAETISDIIKQDDWCEMLEKETNKNRSEYRENGRFLCYFDCNNLINRITNCTNSDLNYFRNAIHHVYSGVNISNYFKDDIATIDELANKLKMIETDEKVKKVMINYIVGDLDRMKNENKLN